MKKSIHTAEQKKLQEQLRRLRIEANLSQSNLAKRLAVPQSFVSKYESGERRLDVLELRQVCAALNVSLIEFIAELEEKIS
jgi:transcriptional regulator with XRE-family HTH domain